MYRQSAVFGFGKIAQVLNLPNLELILSDITGFLWTLVISI